MSEATEKALDNTGDPVPVLAEGAPVLPEWKERELWEAKTSLAIRKQYEDLFLIWKQTELVELEKKNDEVINTKLKEFYAKIKEELKPPTDEEIQQLLDQEYKTFKIKLDFIDDDESKSEMCVIRELPQAAEKKFFKQFKETVLKNASELQALTQETVDQPFEVKAKAFLGLFSESFDMLADAVVIVLNPFDKKTHITREWVQNNISSDRQWRFIEAQMEVNRLKDFFSRLSQSGLTTQTIMTGQSFQQLQRHVP